jgi:DNA-binding transcriptional MerR regulator
MTEDYTTIRDMCMEFDVTPRALRFYEAKELLFPLREGQRRLYTRRDRARLKLILRGKRYGISLEDIRQLLNLYEIGDRQVTQLSRAIEVARARRAELERQLDEVAECIAALGDDIAHLETELTARQHLPAA